MKTQDDRNGVSATLGATLSVFNLLPQLAAMVAGVGVLALFVGWRRNSAYFSELGAPWITPMVSSSELVKSSMDIFAFVGIVALGSIFLLLQGAATRRGLTWWSVVIYLLGAALFSTTFFPEGWVTARTANSYAVFAGILIAASAALTLGEMVAHLAERGSRWDKHSIYLGYFAFFVGFLWAPGMVGEANAKLDGDLAFSRLPVVAISNDSSGRTWRLLGRIDGSFLILSLAAQKKDFVFRVVGANEIVGVRSSGIK